MKFAVLLWSLIAREVSFVCSFKLSLSILFYNLKPKSILIINLLKRLSLGTGLKYMIQKTVKTHQNDLKIYADNYLQTNSYLQRQLVNNTYKLL